MAPKDIDILLIFPPIRVWDCPRNFPTGLGLIAAELRQAGWRVGVMDVNGRRLSDREVLDEIKQVRPKVIGMGGLITTYGWVKRLTAQIRRVCKDIPIVLGGSVGGSIVETALTRLDIDAVAVGEADETILELLPALVEGKSLAGIASVAYRENGQVVRTATRDWVADLNKLPYPAWDLFPMDVYLQNPVVGVGRDVDVISSRGCPFDCGFCYKIFGRQFRGRSAAHVVGEMEALKIKYDVDFISFQDDCFVIDKKRVYEICDLIDRSKRLRGIRWSCNGRVTVCDDDLVRRMKASGCVSVAFGVESGSETILRAMNKKATLDQTAEAIEMCRRAGLRTPLAFMMGYPGETRATVMETVAFCQRLNIPLSGMTFTCPYPGTPLYRQLRESGRLTEDEESLVLRMGDAADFTVNLTDMSDEELVALRAEAIELAQRNYTPPSKEQQEAQQRQLYGEELYRKAQEQMRDPRMQAHRRRHGFNEGVEEKAAAKTLPQEKPSPTAVWEKRRPYIIAEIGVNHDGRLGQALTLIDAAVEAGADAVKFQAFTADALVTSDAAKAQYQTQCGQKGESQRDMLRRYELAEGDWPIVRDHCRQRQIDFMVTPFSPYWTRRMAQLGAAALKIGSGNLTAEGLLEAIARTHLAVILSTGMAELNEVERALSVLAEYGAGPLALLHCVSLYPTPLEKANLGAMAILRRHTGLTVGFSDHTRELMTGALAVAAGAGILEKHLTLDQALEGPDHAMSLTAGQFKTYVKLARQADGAMGTGQMRPAEEEAAVRDLVRMSLAAAQDIPRGTVITAEMLTEKRPGTGIAPQRRNEIVGRTAQQDIAAGRLLQEADLAPLEICTTG